MWNMKAKNPKDREGQYVGRSENIVLFTLIKAMNAVRNEKINANIMEWIVRYINIFNYYS